MKTSYLFVAYSRQPASQIYADPSVWYRCYQPASALRLSGRIADVVPAEVLNEKHIERYDVVIFFRPVYSGRLVEFVEKCESLGKKYFASYDDLFFDINHLKNSGYRKLYAPQAQILSERPELHAKAFYFFDNFIVSTEGLKNSVIKNNDKASVYYLFNGIPPEISGWTSLLRNKKRKGRIGYFAGGAIHSHDLEKIKDPLRQILLETDAEFFCVETVDVPTELKATGKVITTPRMNYTSMVHAYAECSVTIAPLENNEFTNCKSSIKFLESASMGSRVVATPILDVQRVGNELLFKANSLDDWYASLKSALGQEVNDKVSVTASNSILEKFSTRAEAAKFISQIEAK